MNFFNIDSPVYRFMTLLFDAMFVGLLWLLTSIPLVTIGASTAAAYYVLMRRISDREQSVFMDYFKAFKNNFKHGTILFLILAAFFTINLINFFYSDFLGWAGILMNAFCLLFAIELVFMFVHAFALMSRFDMSFLQLVRTALIMAHRHLITTITHIGLLVALYFLVNLFPVVFFFAFGLYCWISSLMLVRMYRKYAPELDKDDECEGD